MAVWSVAGLVSVPAPVKSCEFKLVWAVCIHCCVIFAASAFISEMSSRLIKKTKRRPAICKEIPSVSTRVQWNGSVWMKGNWVSWDDLHYGIVVKFPLVSRQDWSSIDVDGSSPFIGNEKVSVILQFDDSCWQKYKNLKIWQGSWKCGSQHFSERAHAAMSLTLFQTKALCTVSAQTTRLVNHNWRCI